MKVASIRGVDIRISPFFVLIGLAGAWLGGQEILLMAAALVGHEMAHAAAACLLGVKITSIELFPLGGQILTEDLVGVSPGKEMGVAVAGPGVSLFLALVTYIMKGNLDISGFPFFMQFNLVLGLFNLLPSIPLDGGRILKALLTWGFGLRRAARGGYAVSLMVAGVLMTVGIYLSLQDWLALNLIILAVFLAYKAYQERVMLAYSMTRFYIRKKALLDRQIMLPIIWAAGSEQLRVGTLLERIRPGYMLIVLVIEAEGSVRGVLSESQLIEGFLEKGAAASIGWLLNRTLHSD